MATRALPFKDRGQLVAQGGAVVLDPVKLSAWPLPTPRETPNAEAYDWTGEADIAAAGEIVGKPNRTFIVDGRRLKIIGAATNEFVPHVQLQLREIRPGG